MNAAHALLIWSLIGLSHLPLAHATDPTQLHEFEGKWIVTYSEDTGGIITDAIGCTLEIHKNEISIAARDPRSVQVRFRATETHQGEDSIVLHITNVELGLFAKLRLAKHGEKAALVINASDKGLKSCDTPTFEKGGAQQSVQLQRYREGDKFVPAQLK